MREDLRNRIPREEFDYQTLLEGLKNYSRPRDKITALLRRGEIIRVKKGIYVFGAELSRGPFSREVLANMIYGPSYISLEYALQYYGLIPERVEALTSVTVGRGRRFHTPVGLFIYKRVPLQAFAIGIDQIELPGGGHFLMATPEKALADKIQDDRGTGIRSRTEMQEYLLSNLRIESERLKEMNLALLGQIAARYGSRKIRLLSDLLGRSHV